jgi:hypothetical protein
MTMLTAMPPLLAYEGRDTGVAALEKPIDVMVGPVRSDGEILGPDRLATFAYFVYRRLASGAAYDIWDDESSMWSSELDTTIKRKPTQLAYQPEKPDEPWKGVLVGAGGKDAGGAPKFSKAAGGYPLYSVRAFFEITDGSDVLLTGGSENFAFVAGSDKDLMVLGPGEGEELDEATEARLLLKNTSLQTIGGLLIERDAPGASVTLDNSAGASIVLHPDGRIEITPAVGERVVVAGDLETERITYRPSGGGPKQILT